MKNSVTLEIIVIIQGEYKGAAYSICKLKCRVPNKVPIVDLNVIIILQKTYFAAHCQILSIIILKEFIK